MNSPQKGKDKKKETVQSKKRQLLNAFHQNLAFLQMFSSEDLDYLEERIHIFVFAKGQILAKEKQTIDYLGVIAQGRAVAKSKHFQIGDLIGQNQLFGAQIYHEESIIGQSDGIIIAIRIYDLLALERASLRNKVISQIAANHTAQLMKRQSLWKQITQFQTIDEKKVAKYFSPELNNYFKEIQSKQKAKFISFFPFYVVKQKQLVANNTLKPYLLYVVQGQAIAKTKQDQKMIESGKFYNIENFIFEQSCQENVYCLSSEAVILIIDKEILQNNFKTQTFKLLLAILIRQLSNRYKKEENKISQKGDKQTNQWNIFKKYPNSQILPLPKKTQASKKKTTQMNAKEQNLAIFQTLFCQQLKTNDKRLKTNTSVAQSGYDKLYTLKSQSQAKQMQSSFQLQKLRKEVQILSQKLKFNQQISKETKLQLIQSKSRTSMGQVFKQIKKLYQQNQVAHSNPNTNEKSGDEHKVTFKQAFEKQMKQSKTQILVAKCAFKWLYLTRKKKASVKKG